MGAFQYVALDARGKEQKGLIEGDTARQVRQLLRDRSLTPVQIEAVESQEKAEAKKRFSLRRGIGALDLAITTRQLATLARAGLPLDEALQAVSQQTEKARLKSIVLGVRAKVIEGHPLAAGLEQFPQAFPPVYRATVAAGTVGPSEELEVGRTLPAGPLPQPSGVKTTPEPRANTRNVANLVASDLICSTLSTRPHPTSGASPHDARSLSVRISCKPILMVGSPP